MAINLHREKHVDSNIKLEPQRVVHFSCETWYKIGCIRPRRDTYITAWRAPLSFRARGRVYKKLGAKRGREERRKKDRYDLLSPANSVSPPCTPTAFAFIHLFPFHGSPSNPPVVPSRACPRRIVSPFARPLCSAPSLKVTDCLLYYPLVSIFTLLSEALPTLYCSRGEFVWSQYGLEGLQHADHCHGVVGSLVTWQCTVF